MKRYQVYLNQHSVSILDDLGKQTDISRSKLIQGATQENASLGAFYHDLDISIPLDLLFLP